jgi:hypothetical protein
MYCHLIGDSQPIVLQKSKSEKPARRAESQAGHLTRNNPALQNQPSLFSDNIFESLGHLDSRKGRKPATSIRLTAGDNGKRATKL